MTKIGGKISDLIKDRKSKEADRIKKVIEKMKELGVSHDYKNLSIAAKMDHILKIEGKLMTTREILEEANAIGWKIEKSEAKEAVNFLKKLELINLNG